MPSGSFSFEKDLWETLAEDRRDVWLYGMGNGADKILAVLAARGIPVKGVFASNAFARDKIFHGMPLLSFDAFRASAKPENTVVLLAFGSAREDVLSLIAGVAAGYDLKVPDVPVRGEALFDRAFFAAHREELSAARALLADEGSKTLFDRIVRYKLTGDLSCLLSAVSPAGRDWEYLSPGTVRRAADFGAYDGDTARELLALSPLSFLLCAEPDERNFRKLSAFAETVKGCTVECRRAAVCDRVGEISFGASGNRNAGISETGKTVSVPASTADALLAGRQVDYIKYDVEGAEYAALTGTAETISAFAPRLRVAAYHRSEDLFTLPLLLHRMRKNYRFTLTRKKSVPAWDVDLIAAL